MKKTSPLTGPGSQPESEDGDFAFMELPKGMQTYGMPEMPEPENSAAFRPALEKLEAVLTALRLAPKPGASIEIDLRDLDAANRSFIDQALGEGEVSIIAGAAIQVQESVLAGVWRVHEVDESGALAGDVIEVGEFPQARPAGRARCHRDQPSSVGCGGDGRSHERARACRRACGQACHV